MEDAIIGRCELPNAGPVFGSCKWGASDGDRQNLLTIGPLLWKRVLSPSHNALKAGNVILSGSNHEKVQRSLTPKGGLYEYREMGAGDPATRYPYQFIDYSASSCLRFNTRDALG